MKLPTPAEAFTRLKEGDRIFLARMISIAESRLSEHKKFMTALLELCGSGSATSRRIGITGVPGAGKSTLINVLGTKLTALGQKVAVLAIDPSSNRTGGSILGDKTRMNELAADKSAFIRPSPAGGYSGGINAGTRSSVILCEAAGFETILIETVGVGQSETAVEGMVDFLILLMLPGSGDELQGIKRGIMEIADCLVIHKSDGDMARQAEKAIRDFSTALRLFPAHPFGWETPVLPVSSLEDKGTDELTSVIDDFFTKFTQSDQIANKRKSQEIAALYEILREQVLRDLREDPTLESMLKDAEKKISDGTLNAPAAAAYIASGIRTVFSPPA